MEIRKNKRIGKVLFIVEGGKHEFSLMKKIFGDILGYKRIEKRRTNATYYVSKTDSHSVVAVINTRTSNIESIQDREYLDLIYEELIEKYAFDVTNAAVYYIFDRDPKSNTDAVLIQGLIHKLKNSRENEENIMGGMLILSYPSIEAYEVSNFVDDTYKISAPTGAELKKLIAGHAQVVSLNRIDEQTICHACEELLEYLKKSEVTFDIDEFESVNSSVFRDEETYYQKNKSYFLLSMISCVLIDLGIIDFQTQTEVI